MYRVVVVLENRVYVYNFSDLRLVDAIDTCNNTKRIIAVNPETANCFLATPGTQKGTVRVAVYGTRNENFTFKAHDSTVEQMALTNDGSVLATASETGTIFRLF